MGQIKERHLHGCFLHCFTKDRSKLNSLFCHTLLNARSKKNEEAHRNVCLPMDV